MEKFEITEEVYFVTDVMNEPFLIVGIVDRGDCIRYLVSDKNGEKEVAPYEITKEKIIR